MWRLPSCARLIACADCYFLKLVPTLLAVFGGRGTFAARRLWQTRREPESSAQALGSGGGYHLDAMSLARRAEVGLRWLGELEPARRRSPGEGPTLHPGSQSHAAS